MITQVEWTAVMGTNPSKFRRVGHRGLRPVESVSWLDCQEFIAKVNDSEVEQRLGLSGVWRLPTAIEWEYACRAGSTTRWYHSDRDNELDEVAWHGGNSGATTREVGQRKGSLWGLSDCHGNVAEWTDSEKNDKRVTKVVLG